jgi:hypothetical protein
VSLRWHRFELRCRLPQARRDRVEELAWKGFWQACGDPFDHRGVASITSMMMDSILAPMVRVAATRMCRSQYAIRLPLFAEDLEARTERVADGWTTTEVLVAHASAGASSTRRKCSSAIGLAKCHVKPAKAASWRSDSRV